MTEFFSCAFCVFLAKAYTFIFDMFLFFNFNSNFYFECTSEILVAFQPLGFRHLANKYILLTCKKNYYFPLDRKFCSKREGEAHIRMSQLSHCYGGRIMET
jgi:hypothetical protein